MPGGKRNVFFFVKGIGHKSDRMPRNNFFDERYASLPHIVFLVMNIETQIDFFEVCMKRDGETPYSCVDKSKTHKTYITQSVPFVDFSFKGNEWAKNGFVNHIICDSQFAPFCCKEIL